jgi:hypothetical protein
MNPLPPTTVLSESHCSVSPTLIATFVGPVVPEYDVLPIVM